MTPPHQPREATARDIALEVLIAVSTENAYATLLLSQLLRRHRTDRRDSALATELVFGTLRLQGRYDAVIAACSTRPLERIDPVVRDALRLGSHQILDMATPAYAAVSATVDQVRRRRGPGAAKFANAILRAVARRSWPEWLAEIAPFPEQAVGEIVGSSLSGQAAVSSVQLEGRQSEELLPRWEVEFSHPVWIIRSLLDALDKQRARDEIEALLQRNNEPAPVTLVARPTRISARELTIATGGETGRWSPWAVRVAGDPGRFAAVRDHRAAVQDEGSQLMALAVSRLDTPPGDWLDLCAGPGGKTADLAGPAASMGATLTAVEQHPHRADLIRQTVAGGPPVDVRTGDALEVGPQRYSRILLDAPCTGLGALRRRPELRWRRTPADLPQLRASQLALLARAVDLLVPGGCLAYVTCSPHVAETHDIVSAVRRRHPDLQQVPAAHLLPEVADCAVGDFVQLWPHRHDTDAMFLAVLRRPM